MKKYISFLLLFLVLLLSPLAVKAQAAETGGSCGKNLSWKLDSRGTLTITGTGAMENYGYYYDNHSPWYESCESIDSVIIGKGVTSIGDYAFESCSSLSSVTIPDSVTRIGASAFSGCSSLSGITIPDSITHIGNSVFYDCSQLYRITIPDSVSSIGDSVFFGCANLSGITMPKRISSIGNYAFYDCSSLSAITIPEGITSIGDSAFYSCSSLSAITIPEGVTRIGDSAFYDCSHLSSITLPNSITAIGDSTFSGCSSLSAIAIPQGVTKIGDFAFSRCTSLSGIIIPEGVTQIGDYAFEDCSGLSTITIPKRVSSIGCFAFSGCSKLSSITIPNSVKTIGDYAFAQCPIVTITIPKSVTGIGSSVFSDCGKLTDVYYGGTAQQWNALGVQSSVKRIHYSSTSEKGHWSRETVPENCGKDGHSGDVCPCGYSRNMTYTKATGDHSYTSSPAPRGTTYACTVCGHSYFEEFDFKFHLQGDVGEALTIELKSSYDYGYSLTGENAANVSATVTGKSSIIMGSLASYRVGYSLVFHQPGEYVLAFVQQESGNTVYFTADISYSNPFADVAEGAYYLDPVLWAVANGITNGMDATHFAPDGTCTRAQIVTFLWRANGSPAPTAGNNPFTDVPAGQWYTQAVLWAVEQGITAGTSAVTFSPDSPCTRGQVATFLWRAQGQPDTNASNIFWDIAPDAYYYRAVLWAVANGVTNGMGDGTFAPDAACTRGQIVTFLYRAMA